MSSRRIISWNPAKPQEEEVKASWCGTPIQHLNIKPPADHWELRSLILELNRNHLDIRILDWTMDFKKKDTSLPETFYFSTLVDSHSNMTRRHPLRRTDAWNLLGTIFSVQFCILENRKLIQRKKKKPFSIKLQKYLSIHWMGRKVTVGKKLCSENITSTEMWQNCPFILLFLFVGQFWTKMRINEKHHFA